MRLLFCAALSVLAIGTFAAEDDLPSFEDYRVERVSSGLLDEVDLDSHPNASRFRTRLSDNEGHPANFAGHYILTYWGCGSSCQLVTVIDIRDGSVSFPFDSPANLGVCFRKDSRLVIVNPMDEALVASFEGSMPDWVETRYYYWDGVAMQKLIGTRRPVTVDCEY